MATEKKSWNDMDAKEQDDRRKKERRERNFVYSYANKNLYQAQTYLKSLTEDMSPEEAMDEEARLTALGIARAGEEERAYKKSYENKWSQSPTGIRFSVENQRSRQELSDFNRDLSNGRNQMSYIERQELNRKKLELQDQLRFSDAQLAENKNSWISQAQSEDDRLAAYNEQKDEQEHIESKYGKGFQGDPGGSATGKMQMQMPPRNKPQQKQGQPKGMPREFVQSPAMAQRRRPSRPYDARTGHSLSDTQLNNFYRNDAALYRQVGGASPNAVAQNPFLKESNFNRS